MVSISGTERRLKCNTLLLSLGLIPENELSKNANIEIDYGTGGPIVNQNFETTLEGIFACGNCLTVYDTVDLLSMDAKRAGINAARYEDLKKHKSSVHFKAGKGVRFVVPQIVDETGIIQITLRSETQKEKSSLKIIKNNRIILKKKLSFVNPANMVKLNVEISPEMIKSGHDLEVMIDDES
jgi:pyruvate/2-oxoglutarate dehydrogenase complex dihydrolipoamide dehydrogenase (E3) component